MIKKILIVTMLLTSSVNADMFQALKDAASTALQEYKVAQEKFNTSLNGEGTQVVVDNRQFNSLAEEEAYKKQQKQQEEVNAKKHEQEIKNSIVTGIQNLRASEVNFYQKYLVKQNDTQEMIDDKFKNKTQLSRDMQKDFTELDKEREHLADIIDRNLLDNVLSESFKEATRNRRELDSIFTNASDAYPDGYVLECHNLEPYIEVDVDRLYNSYEEYLKCTYFTHQQRQDIGKETKAYKVKQAKEQQELKIRQLQDEKERVQAQKEQQIRLANEQKERQKVQNACQIWRTKANKQVYSLGVGDKVAGKGTAYYVIQGVNANTFLVNTLWGPIYLQKSDLIPYESLKTAPSQYCYR